MVTPKTLLWERDLHTAAKHALVSRYLQAWFPIMTTTFRDTGITILDGYAGPGEYTNSIESSPVIIMEQALRPEVTSTRAPLRLIFIEEQRERAEHLAALLARRFPPYIRPPHMHAAVHQGDCGDLYEQLIADAGGWAGPVFANLDGWGVDTGYDVVQRIARQRSSEVLVTFQEQFFTRFADVQDQQAGDRVFGVREWRDVAKQPTPNKKPFLLNLYRQRLIDAGFTYILTFEMVDEGGHALYLFFGTTSVRAVEKFKDGLWEVDVVGGQRFRDPRHPDQLSLDVNAPDYTPLRNEVLALVTEHGEMGVEDLRQHTLIQTIYRKPDAKHAVDWLVEHGKLELTATGRSYSEQRYRIANRLF